MNASALVTDARSLDPVSYVRAVGLRPEDSFGFLPVEQSDGSALIYVYRDRPEYAAARAGLPGPSRSRLLGGLVEVDRPGGIELDVEGGTTRVVTPAPQAPARQGSGGAPIVSHRLYPGLRTRSSGKQLNHFLPRYLEVVGLAPEDVYGVFAQGIHLSGGESSAREWESVWIVYRDRPEYVAGRDAYAAEMDKRGNWPAPVFSDGAQGPPAIASGSGKLQIKKQGWPRRRLVMHATPEGLAESVAETVRKLGYEPEHAYGLCPDFQQRKYFAAWRR